MPLSRALPLAMLATVAALAAAPAQAQVYVTSVTAALPDPAGKVPAFNAVPGSGIPNWANGLAHAVLTHGQAYNYCVSLASAAADGSATVLFKLSRGRTVIQTHRIVEARNFKIGPNGIWYLCSGYLVLPSNAGAAVLWGQVQYTPTGADKPIYSSLSVPVLLQ